MQTALIYAALGTGFTFLMTTAGAAVVFLFRKEISSRTQRLCLGFAAGVMMAASIWSLLIPAIEDSSYLGRLGFLPAACGFVAGGVFICGMDYVFRRVSGKIKNDNTLFVTAVTMHNIPEGMSVGAAFAMAALSMDKNMFYAAAVFAFGIGIQNFPEGAAISLPLRDKGCGRLRAFIIGMLSGIVEPIAGILTVLVASSVQRYMPWMLSFAAGAMIYVVVDELIPKVNERENERAGTMAVIGGFLIMMILDVALS